jgi:hypothetical protein
VGFPDATAGYMALSAGTNSIAWNLPFIITNYAEVCPGQTVTNVSFVGLGFSGAVPAGQWIHLAATWRSSDGLAVIYTNGVQVASTNLASGATIPSLINDALTLPPGTTGRTGSALLGAGSFQVTGFSAPTRIDSTDAGGVDNLRVYTRALSSSEIQQIMVADAGALTTNCVTSDAVTTNLDFCTVPPGELQILSGPPDNVQLFWPSQTNTWFLLEGTDELSPLNWLNVWGPGLGNGSNVTVLDPTALRPHRFYRLLSSP